MCTGVLEEGQTVQTLCGCRPQAYWRDFVAFREFKKNWWFWQKNSYNMKLSGFIIWMVSILRYWMKFDCHVSYELCLLVYPKYSYCSLKLSNFIYIYSIIEITFVYIWVYWLTFWFSMLTLFSFSHIFSPQVACLTIFCLDFFLSVLVDHVICVTMWFLKLRWLLH